MSYYVKRDNPAGNRVPGHSSWTGPIRSEKQAGREAAAWIDAGWTARVVPSSPEVKREISTWVRLKDAGTVR